MRPHPQPAGRQTDSTFHNTKEEHPTGCWSERCALTGLEITNGQVVYVACISDQTDDFYGQSLATPPVKGAYDDYGGIDLLEDVELLGFKYGQSWRPDEEDQRPTIAKNLKLRPVFIHAEIFDKIPELRPEFDYTTASVGRIVDGQVAKLTALVDLFEGEGNAGAEKDKLQHATQAALRQSLGYPQQWESADEILDGILDAGKDAEEFLGLYRRVLLLKCAERELRQPLVSSRVGPQHGGEMALRQMNDWVRDILDTKDQVRKEDSGHHTYASGGQYDLPFEVFEPLEGQIEVVSADGAVLWSAVTPDDLEPNRFQSETNRRRAFADWMVARLNA